MGSPNIRRSLKGLFRTRGLEQIFSQPRRIALFNAKSLAEYASLVPPARVRCAEAIVLDLTEVEDGLIAAG
jgi:hypothetical protein